MREGYRTTARDPGTPHAELPVERDAATCVTRPSGCLQMYNKVHSLVSESGMDPGTRTSCRSETLWLS